MHLLFYVNFLINISIYIIYSRIPLNRFFMLILVHVKMSKDVFGTDGATDSLGLADSEITGHLSYDKNSWFFFALSLVK